jgi:hypothetical protein
MKIFKSFLLIINYKTFIAAALSVVSCVLCVRYNIKAEFPMFLLSIAIVFPIVFSIDSAYKRREFALQQFADFRAHALSFYFGVRDWIDIENHTYSASIKLQLTDLMKLVSSHFMKEPEKAKGNEVEIYTQLSRLSNFTSQLKLNGTNAGEYSRLHQYVSKMSISYGVMKNIFYYRTPLTLRAYSKIFIYSFPIMYGPYCASTLADYTYGLAYIMPVLYTLILVSLDNIQEHLENPFDQIGEDDIKFDIEEFEQIMLAKPKD